MLDLLVVLLLDDVHLADAEELGKTGPENGRLLLDALPAHDHDGGEDRDGLNMAPEETLVNRGAEFLPIDVR